MKRFISFLLAILLTVPLFVGCGDRNKLDAVIILPGIMGSELYLAEDAVYDGKEYEADTKLWIALDTVKQILAVPKHIEMLSPDSGCSIRAEAPTVNNFREEQNYGTLNTYGALYETLYYEFGSECDVIFYSYDWREDPYVTAREFDKYLKEHGYNKVSIVAHSMGGLVASHFFAMGRAQRKKIHTYISLGTPYLGSEEAAYAMLTGNIDTFFANLLISNEARALCPKLDSMYALLPYEYLWRNTLSVYSVLGTSQAESFKNEQALLSKYIDNYSSVQHDKAEEKKDQLFTKKGKHISELVNSYYLVGDGEKTIVTVNIPNDPLLASTVTTVTRSDEGDGTVSLYSATVGGTLPSDRTFIKTTDGEFLADHESLASGSDITTLRFIVEVLRGNADSISDHDLYKYYNIAKAS